MTATSKCEVCSLEGLRAGQCKYCEHSLCESCAADFDLDWDDGPHIACRDRAACAQRDADLTAAAREGRPCI